jgi:hypothetical protein
MRNIDLSEYYDSEYTETESEYSSFEDETESEDEDGYSNNMTPLMIIGTLTSLEQ